MSRAEVERLRASIAALTDDYGDLLIAKSAAESSLADAHTLLREGCDNVTFVRTRAELEDWRRRASELIREALVSRALGKHLGRLASANDLAWRLAVMLDPYGRTLCTTCKRASEQVAKYLHGGGA